MSAKILQALSDENPELKRQIGCMTGIFQLFDRSHVISSKRINAPKRPPPGHSVTIPINSETEALTSSPRLSVEKIGGRYVTEHERISVESSTTSVSSTSFSSFSSLEYHRAAQSEAPTSTPSRASKFQSTEHSNAKNTPGLHYHSSATTLPSRQFHGAREVTDTTLREPYGMSVKTKIKDDYISPVFKDSPRPLQLSRSLDGGAGGTRKSKVPLDLNESLRVLAKLKEGPWHSNEAREPARATSEVKRASYAAKEFPRFSYDGRELSRSSFDSRETSKMSSRFTELPRLSLDSRQTSVRSSSSDSHSNAISKGLHSDNYRDAATCNRSSSVVAKLMGLEPLPGSKQIDETQIGATNCSSRLGSFIGERNGNMSPGNLKMSDTPKLERCASSPKCAVIDNPSPKTKNSYPASKPNFPPKFPIETAPWKQRESGGVAKKPVTKHSEVTPRQPTSQSVYSEIEKRLNDLDFKQSHKDLRALKQIIEAMQAKRQNANKKEEQETAAYATLQRSNVVTSQSKNVNSLPTKVIGSPRARESPIIVIKPTQKSGSFSSSLMPLGGPPGVYKSKSMDASDSQTSYNERIEKNKESRFHLRNSRGSVPSTEEKTISKIEEARSPRLKVKSVQSSSPRNQIPLKEKIVKSSNTSSSSPRLPQRKVEVERRTRSTVASPELNKPTKRQPGRQIEMGSPGTRRGVRSIQSDDQSSEMSSDTRHFNRGGDEMSVISDSSGSFLSQVDGEATSGDRSVDLIASLHHKSSFSSSGVDGIGFAVGPQQPSPISVLDASFDHEDDFMPSPVKYSSNAFRDVDGCILEETFAEAALDDESNISTDISKKELQTVQVLALKLRQLNSGHTGAFTYHIAAPLCNDTNPDHRYVSEILNASGILVNDFKSHAGPLQVHSSGHVINPELFLVLEQLKASSITETSTLDDSFVQKQHRKLVFDTVNEVLVRKLPLAKQAEPWLLFRNLKSFVTDGQHLLKELCVEVDQLCPSKLQCVSDKDDADWLENMLAADVTHRDESWTHFDKEIPHLVLDVERLIFKDLIDEIVSKEASTLREKPGNRRRKLYTK